MRYAEIVEAASDLRKAKRCERSAREQIAAADKKRADAARKYQDQVATARSAAAKAQAKLRANIVPEAIEFSLGCRDTLLTEASKAYALRNRAGTILGWIEPVGRLLQAKDPNGSILGWYDPRTNQTRDKTGSIVGDGDFLSALVVTKGQL